MFPSECRICHAPLTEISRLPVCSRCIDSVRGIEGELCSICGERVFHFGPVGEMESICGMCRRARPAYTRAVAYGAYDGELRELIHLLKYEQVRPAAELLGTYLAQAIDSLKLDSDGGQWKIVPVPLHRARRRQRGFNQAELIARAAVRRLGSQFELKPNLLGRRRPTSSQTGLTNHQRRANLRGAFVVMRPAELHNHPILLVDDVFTTGTTAAECSRVLLRAGARAVAVATVARVFKGEPARPVGFSHGREMAKGVEA